MAGEVPPARRPTGSSYDRATALADRAAKTCCRRSSTSWTRSRSATTTRSTTGTGCGTITAWSATRPEHGSWDGHRERDDADRRRLRLKTAQGDADDRCRGFRSHRSSNRLRQYLPDSLADTLIVVGGVAVAAAIVAGFATGVCEVVALLGGGYATAAAIAFPLSRAGVRDTPSRARWPPPPQARARPRPLHSPSRSAPPRDCGERTRRRLAVSAPEPSGEPAESASRGAHTRAR